MRRKTNVITGASDGIGAVAARWLSACGHRVIVVGRTPSKTHAFAPELGTDFHVAHVTELSEVRVLADELLAKYPRIEGVQQCTALADEGNVR